MNPSPPDPHNLKRFVLEQDGIYPTALAELQAGHKRTHWMWFIFPQVAGLGTSPMAEMFAINSLDEARHYLAHPLLGPRLRRCASELLTHHDKSAEHILGYIDALKLRSSMTLFTLASPDDLVFSQVLDALYDGVRDSRTTRIIEEW